MLNSIINKLGFGTGVAEQATVVAAAKVSQATKAAVNATTSVDYAAKAKELKQEFSNGRASGKEYVTDKMNIEKIKQIANSEEYVLITL